MFPKLPTSHLRLSYSIHSNVKELFWGFTSSKMVMNFEIWYKLKVAINIKFCLNTRSSSEEDSSKTGNEEIIKEMKAKRVSTGF